MVANRCRMLFFIRLPPKSNACIRWFKRIGGLRARYWFFYNIKLLRLNKLTILNILKLVIVNRLLSYSLFLLFYISQLVFFIHKMLRSFLNKWISDIVLNNTIQTICLMLMLYAFTFKVRNFFSMVKLYFFITMVTINRQSWFLQCWFHWY